MKMKKPFFKHALLPLPLALAAAVPAAQAARVEVTWVNPESYSDVQATYSTQARFRERVLTDLQAQFMKSGARLPEGQLLDVSIRDVDLAGYIDYFQPAAPFGIRLIRNVDFPRIKLDYELRDADGKVIGSGSETLSDPGFRFPTFTTRMRNPLDYEKRMIDRWYRENFG
jgi:hypothetical protein